MPRPLRYAIEALLIYLVYNVLGDINREFTPPPSGISPIWLPAGFAVGVILTRGWWTAIPLFLTGFVNTLRADLSLAEPVADGGFGLATSTIMWAAVLYGLAVAGHCVVARMLVDRMRDHRYEGVLGATLFLLYVGPVSCIVSALLGTEVFRVEGFISSETFAVSAFTFWLGDSMACMLIAPVMVAMLGGPSWRTRRVPIVVLAVATSAIVLASTALVGRIELERIRQTFERSTARAVAVLESRIRRIENLALDQAVFVSTTGDLSQRQFEDAANDKLERSHGAATIAFIETPEGDIEASSVRQVAGAGSEDLRASFTPAPVVDVLRRARDTGRPTWASTAEDPGAVDDFVYAPVYDGELDAGALSTRERRERLVGFVAVRTDLQVALEAAIGSVVDRQAASVLRAERREGEPVVLATQPRPEENPLVDPELSPLAAARTKGVPFATSREFQLGQSPWSVTFAPSRSFVADRAFLVTVLPSSMIALAFTLTIGVLSLTSTGQRAKLERLVRRRTRLLAASEHRYRSVVENVNEAIFQLDADDRVTFVSSAWDDALSDGGRERVVGARLTTALRVADPLRLEELLATARSRPGSTVRGEFEAAGRDRALEIRLAAPSVDDAEATNPVDGDDANAIVGLVVDVTERQRVVRNRERFVSLVAHELRNPLTVISGSIATISQHESEQLPPLATKLLPSVLTSAHRLDRVISDLLVSSQVDAGTLTLMKTPADVMDVVRGSIETASLRASEANVSLEHDDDAEPIVVSCDVDRITQVVDNLLSNAIKYTPAGGHVHVEVVLDDDAREVRVHVRDSGIGIAPDDLDRIFERYGRTEQGVIVAPGTGLGLSICRSIAQAHGGTIEVESELGVGSRFTLVLPVH